MDKTNKNPEIRVYPHTRTKLKVLAAQHEMTMLDFVEWLVNQQIEREKKGEQHNEQKNI